MQNIENNKQQEIDLSEIIYNYTRHWKWFIVSLGICLAIGIIVILTSQKQYSTSLSVLLNEEQTKSNNSDLMNLEAMGLLSTTNNIENEIAIFSSLDLISQVVDSLNIQTSYFTRRGLRTVEIYKKRPFSVKYDEPIESQLSHIELNVKKNDNNQFDISGSYIFINGDDDIDFSEKDLTFPATIQLPEGLGQLEFTPEMETEDSKWDVEIKSIAKTTLSISEALTIKTSGKNSSVIQLSITQGNKDKGSDFLKELVRQYNELNVKVKNELAYNTSIFVNERLRQIEIELNDIEKEVVDYRKKNKITDIGTESQLFVEQTNTNEQKLLDTETQLNILNMISQFIENPANKHAMIPNLNISDPGLSQIINAYNTKLLVNEQLIKNTGDDNPSRKRIVEDIDNTRANISSALKNVKSSLSLIKSELKKQSKINQSRISSVPQQEKGLLEKVRLQQVKESLFLFLMQKREETAISIASTADKARIIVSPTLQSLQVSPNTRNILLIAFVLGLLIPVAYIYISDLLKTKITSQAELEKLTNISVIGQICKNATGNYVVAKKNDVSPISEMFRSIRNNINFILKHEDHKVLLITSTTTGEGKSFISLNLALSFALLDKKVLIVGADIRKPKLKTYIGLDGRKGLTDYLASTSDNWSTYIDKVEDSNLDVMISGTIPPNPNELLTSPKLKAFMKEAKSKYDIVILDTAPIGLVSDTYLLNQYADLTLYITRENTTLKTSIEFLNKQKDEGLLKNLYLVLNDTDLNNRYGYRYGYGKGYGYGPSK